MAETVVLYLLERTKQLLIQKTGLLSRVREQFKQLYDNLDLLSIVTEQEDKWKQESIAKEMMKQIRYVAEEAEDVIDSFIIESVKQQQGRRKAVSAVFKRMKNLGEVNQKIRGINTIIRDIYEKQTQLREEESVVVARSLISRRYYYKYEEEEVVGLEDDKELLVKELLGEKEQLEVVSIYGMGGIGKTTLAKSVYNDHQIKLHFDCCSWVSVTQQYHIARVLKEMLMYMVRDTGGKSRMMITTAADDDEEEIELLKDKVHKWFKNKRYLIVLDDVWEHHVLDKVTLALPHTSCGSRILITSRIRSVALYAGPGTFQYSMPFLTEEESWVVFCNKAFRGQNCPPQLKHTARQIVERCHGLPLSLLLAGRLSAYKDNNAKRWSELLTHMDWYFTQHQSDVLDILELSYNDLPWRLKPCFLYLAIYPQSYDIPMRQLAQLWIAEGFIQHTAEKTAEDVAEDYLAELIDRSLVLLSSKRTDGGVKTCRIHDMFRLLCLIESKNNYFLELRTHIDAFSLTKPRRLSLHCTVPHYISSNPPQSSFLRSFLCFSHDPYILETSHWKWFHTSFSLIRLLKLGHVDVKAIPNSIKRLIHLKYFQIESKSLKLVPGSIGKLVNLQTLDLNGCDHIDCLPAAIWKIRELRHVYVSGRVSLLRSNKKSLVQQVSWNLLSLSVVALDQITAELIQKAFFPNLRKLGLRLEANRNKSSHQESGLDNLFNLKHLRTLKIFGSTKFPTSAQAFPQNITKITLVQEKEEGFPSNAISTLSRLPYLGVLKLVGSSKGNKLEFNYFWGGFPMLECLHMSHLHIKEHQVEMGSMPCLRNWTIKNCTWFDQHSQEVQLLHLSSSLAVQFGKVMSKNGGNLRVL